MSLPNLDSVRLLRMPLLRQEEVVLCRQRARAIADALGIESSEQVRIATAVSEIARNAVEYAREGTAEFTVEFEPPKFVITIADLGSGIAQLSEILAGRYHSQTGLGRGIIGARRLMDHVEINSTPRGTTVRLEKDLSKFRRQNLTPSDVQKVVDGIAGMRTSDPLEELALQNRDLTQVLAEVREQKDELSRRALELEQLSTELAETNRGVLALYDELDSLHRLGRVIAAQLDLDSLLQAIIDATTDLNGAEFGAFFYSPAPEGQFRCRAVAGVLRDLKGSFEDIETRQLFGEDVAPTEVMRIGDLESAGPSAILASNFKLRSYLAIPVLNASGAVLGAMIFGHRETKVFSERNERILSAVAVQAAVGMENARLYNSVQAASAAKDHFLATLSHELRTPLNPIFIVLSQLRYDPRLPKDVLSDLAIVQRNLDLEAHLIDDLLDMTRIVKGKIAFSSEIVDVHELLSSVCLTCAPNSQGKKLDVVHQFEASRHHVLGDPARLQQVFWNLLNNAIKFTPDGGRIVISTSNAKDGSELCTQITDTGRGIDATALQQVFHPFEQGEIAGQAQFGGLGLGLSICKSIVDAHGGTIKANSKGTGSGSTFSVTLPVSQLPHAISAPSGNVVSEAPSQALSILLVDDHPDTLSTLQRLLIRRGHRVVTAASASSATIAAASEPLDIVISDIGLPDRSGLDLMRELHERYGLKGIALSGFGTDSDIALSRDAGFCGHLTKPIDFAELERLFASVFSPPESAQE